MRLQRGEGGVRTRLPSGRSLRTQHHAGLLPRRPHAPGRGGVRGRRPPARDGGTLNSPRSAVEYAVRATGAHGGESPEALHRTAAASPTRPAARAGHGWSNLWYLNYSDRAACRMTGMTRHACFWVEDGELVAPLNVMRFDDATRLGFGPGLVGLTATPEFIPNSDTYGARSL